MMDTILNNGAKLIREHRVDNDTRIVLCYFHGVHPWVVWHMSNDGECYWGSYFADAVSAEHYYNEKIN